MAGLISLSPLGTPSTTYAISRLQGQTSVTGVVKDRTGKAYPNAKVTLLNSQQSIIATTQADSDG
ncbi:MAG TPA: carboxypeptidase-like regulatory domain-containing protein, partial [Acidobacteriota bacterium]|nr:carboxypeptidase-like regulatory domain-containing protein [Acidobacteriota bacterium]